MRCGCRGSDGAATRREDDHGMMKTKKENFSTLLMNSFFNRNLQRTKLSIFRPKKF